MVFQQPALFPWMTVAGNAGFGPMVRGAAEADRRTRVEHWLRQVGLWDFRDRYPYELSGGMQQRLAIVRALCNEPKLLLMDEPFGALDALTREKMQEQLHEVWRRTGMTVVFITHSVEEAVYLGTHVAVMSPRPGRILEYLPMPFARQEGERDIRAIKASAEFVTAREHVLSLIWQMMTED
jgi:ABC-type taurine transport system ATPase subunit